MWNVNVEAFGINFFTELRGTDSTKVRNAHLVRQELVPNQECKDSFFSTIDESVSSDFFPPAVCIRI